MFTPTCSCDQPCPCQCGHRQTVNYIVDSCSFTKLKGGLSVSFLFVRQTVMRSNGWRTWWPQQSRSENENVLCEEIPAEQQADNCNRMVDSICSACRNAELPLEQFMGQEEMRFWRQYVSHSTWRTAVWLLRPSQSIALQDITTMYWGSLWTPRRTHKLRVVSFASGNEHLWKQFQCLIRPKAIYVTINLHSSSVQSMWIFHYR